MDVVQGMDRRGFLQIVGAAAAGMWLQRAQGAEVKRPNFIFIFADDLGWGDLRCYGNRQIKTWDVTGIHI